MKMHELLAKPESWTKGNFARDRFGHGVKPSDATAVCWCLAGAAMRCYNDGLREGVVNQLFNRVWQRHKELSLSGWNDRDTTTHADVLALLKELDV